MADPLTPLYLIGGLVAGGLLGYLIGKGIDSNSSFALPTYVSPISYSVTSFGAPETHHRRWH